MSSYDGNKASGPDGFNLSFVKSCWKTLKGDVSQIFGEFHRNVRISKGINKSFISLIPKVENPVGLNDY